MLLWNSDFGELDTLATIVFAGRKGLICEVLGPGWWTALEAKSVDNKTSMQQHEFSFFFFLTFLRLHRAYPVY